MLIPNKFSGYIHGALRRVNFSGGGGGGGGGTQTSYQTNIPEYAQQPYMNLVGKAESLYNAPYRPYQGERQAQFTPLQQQAFSGAQNLQTSQLTGQAAGLAGTVAGGALGAQYTPGTFQADTFGGQQAAQYMSPYIQQAMAPQMREAVRASEMQRQGDQAKAVGAGAFGGSRQAIVEAERQRNLGTQLGDIQARGLQSAYEQASSQFNQDAARRMQAQQLAEQSRQYGAGFGMQGLQTALQGAQQLGGLGQQQFGQQKDILGLQNLYGGQQQQQIQAMLDRGYADYQAAQNYPYQQLGFMSDILRGTQGTTRTMYEPTASPLQALAGTGTALYGASKMFAEGGEVAPNGDIDFTQGGVFQGQGQGQNPQYAPALNFARGGKIRAGQGIEALANKMQYMPPNLLEQKAQAAQNNDLKGYLAAKIAEQEQQKLRAGMQEQQALNAPQPQGTVIQRDLANSGIAAAAPESAGNFADGGIVAFADGGETRSPFAFLNPGDLWSSLVSSTEQKKQAAALAAAQQRQAMGRATPEDLVLLGVVPAVDTSPAAQDANEQQRMRARAEAAKTTTNPFADKAPAPTPDQGKQIAPAAGPSAKPAVSAAAAPTGIAKLANIDPMATEREMFKGYKSDLEAARDAQRSAAERNLSEYDAEMAKLGKLGEERETRLKGREKELEGRKEEIKGNALMQAGLAILAADPKRGLAAAIGTGGQAGLAAYEKDAEKLQAAKDKIQDSLDNISDLRRQEQIATGKERRGLKSEIDKAQVDFAKSVAEASGSRYKVTSEMGAKLYDSMLDYNAKMAAVQASREGHQLAYGARGSASGDKQQLAELKAIQTNLQAQIKGGELTMPPADLKRLKGQLEQVNGAIMRMAGLESQAGAGAPQVNPKDPLGIRQ